MKIKDKVGKYVAVPLEIRFWEKVIKGSDEKCWNWLGWKVKGYGRIKVAGHKKLAHRVSYLLHKGDIPDGMDILHSCDNPSCVNPKHLRAGTHRENMKDMSLRGRATGSRRKI